MPKSINPSTMAQGLIRPWPGVTFRKVQIRPESLVRLSSRNTGEPYFGRSGVYRFDDPRIALNYTKAGSWFGTCYTANSLEVAFAETILHDAVLTGPHYQVSAALLDARFVVEFKGQPLTLADMTGPALKALGLTGALSTIVPYRIPQRWALAAYAAGFDGIQYVSRHLNTGMAFALFDSAASKIAVSSFTLWPAHPDASKVEADLNVQRMM